jgi:hypothetical protein
MSTFIVPLAIGTVVGVIVVVAFLLVIAAGAYVVLTRDNSRQVRVDADRERTEEQLLLHEPADFESDLRPPREED